MVNDYTVICSKDNIIDNKELILSIQKAMLITLFETGKIKGGDIPRPFDPRLKWDA